MKNKSSNTLNSYPSVNLVCGQTGLKFWYEGGERVLNEKMKHYDSISEDTGLYCDDCFRYHKDNESRTQLVAEPRLLSAKSTCGQNQENWCEGGWRVLTAKTKGDSMKGNGWNNFSTALSVLVAAGTIASTVLTTVNDVREAKQRREEQDKQK
ncbi:MAG: hypothetical protein J5542_05780 [Bacteroidales bacterium]|nr:hypothetical protein [Bacteroidales bacterium]